MNVRIISAWFLRAFKRLALRRWVMCQGLEVSMASSLTDKNVIILSKTEKADRVKEGEARSG